MTKTIKMHLVACGATALSTREAAGITEWTWAERMRNPDSWRLGELRRVANVLGVTVAELIGGE